MQFKEDVEDEDPKALNAENAVNRLKEKAVVPKEEDQNLREGREERDKKK